MLQYCETITSYRPSNTETAI